MIIKPSLETLGLGLADAVVEFDGERADPVEDVLHARRVELDPGLGCNSIDTLDIGQSF